MTTKKSQAEKPEFVHTYKFDNGDSDSLPLDEIAFQYLAETARMMSLEDPHFRQLATERMREIAQVLGAIENRKMWQSLINKENARKGRPAAKVDADEDDSIEKEFSRLVREGHTEPEARSILVARGKWTQSTIYRRTKGEEEK